MTKHLNLTRLSRRIFVLGGGAAGLAARAAAEDPILQKLMQQQGGAFSEGFDSASAARAMTVPLAMTSPMVTGTRPLRTIGCHGA